jgi:hypothetical protein
VPALPQLIDEKFDINYEYLKRKFHILQVALKGQLQRPAASRNGIHPGRRSNTGLAGARYMDNA